MNEKIKPIAGAVMILIALVLYAFLARPFSADLSHVQADISSKSEEIETMQERIALFSKTAEENELTDIKKLEINTKIPVGMNQDEVLTDLYDVAKDNDIELNSVSFGKGVSGKEGIGSLRVNASFEGNYQDLIRFLTGIEENSRYFKVSSINVQISALDITSIKRATFSLSFDTYYQLEQ
jgi:Tfp pilus assembly protein PilO